MISLEDLKAKARIKGLSLGNAEKDYLLDILLLSVSKNTKDELVFKGGTCLYKFYNLSRFSEDVDFTAVKRIDMEKLAEDIISDMKQFGVDCRVRSKKEPFNSVLLSLRCEGPLFSGAAQTFSSVRIDVNFKSAIDMEPEAKTFSSMYDIPPFSLLVMQEKEIMAEKIRAIVTRNKARDVYDLWAMVSRGVKIGDTLVSKKLAYYNAEFDYGEFEKAVEKKSGAWERDLKPLLRQLPPFADVKKAILSEAKKWKPGKKAASGAR